MSTSRGGHPFGQGLGLGLGIGVGYGCLAPLACLAILFALVGSAFSSCGSGSSNPSTSRSETSYAAPSPMPVTPASTPPQTLFNSGQRYGQVRTDGNITANMQFARCRVDWLSFDEPRPYYDVNGAVASYSFKVTLHVTNPYTTPRGPRIAVVFWDKTGTKQSEENVAYSLSADLEPGQIKDFEDHVSTPFLPAYFSLREVD